MLLYAIPDEHSGDKNDEFQGTQTKREASKNFLLWFAFPSPEFQVRRNCSSLYPFAQF